MFFFSSKCHQTHNVLPTAEKCSWKWTWVTGHCTQWALNEIVTEVSKREGFFGFSQQMALLNCIIIEEEPLKDKPSGEAHAVHSNNLGLAKLRSVLVSTCSWASKSESSLSDWMIGRLTALAITETPTGVVQQVWWVLFPAPYYSNTTQGKKFFCGRRLDCSCGRGLIVLRY